jgi:hypothetical protein
MQVISIDTEKINNKLLIAFGEYCLDETVINSSIGNKLSLSFTKAEDTSCVHPKAKYNTIYIARIKDMVFNRQYFNILLMLPTKNINIRISFQKPNKRLSIPTKSR